MRLPYLVVVGFLSLASCAEPVDIPEAPNMQPLLLAYASPTANVRAEVMAEWANSILDTQQVIEQTELPEQLLVLVEKLQNAIDSSSGAEGVIRLHHVCSGWDDTQEGDPDVDGIIDLTLTLERGRIGPVVWGVFDECRWAQTVGDRSIEVEYDGEIRAHFGGAFGTDARVRDREVTFEVVGVATRDGASLPIESSFRLDLGRALRIGDAHLDILVEIERGEFFVFFFRAADFTSGVHDATGRFFCSLEERICEKPSGSFSW
jgi:hypothetical protein